MLMENICGRQHDEVTRHFEVYDQHVACRQPEDQILSAPVDVLNALARESHPEFFDGQLDHALPIHLNITKHAPNQRLA
jgi:hypothetical protein